MQFNNTGNIENGIIQGQEFWTRLGDTGISGDATLLAQFTGLTNRAFDRIMPRLLSLTDTVRFDDPNHTKRPVGTIDLTSGQYQYTVTADQESVEILNFAHVFILPTASATEYVELSRLRLDEPGAIQALSPNSSSTGVPAQFIERGNELTLTPKPNYSATNGIKIFFERVQSRFATTDTTKEPGIPSIFHELLALYPSRDWLLVHRNESAADRNLIGDIGVKIASIEEDLDTMIAKRNPMKRTLKPRVESCK